MELNITYFFNEASPRDYSASVAEIGHGAGKATWNHALADSLEFDLLDTDEKREAFRQHVAEFGAWSDEEIAAWSNTELNAVCIQMVSGDIREGGLDVMLDWAQYEADSEAGRVSGRIFRGTDDEIYYDIGS